ncbi:MAG: hypothetical protein JW822_13440 [Spirochaetales bacterium]|nr:hypothetical protein [Spirochaetales bacterium]
MDTKKSDNIVQSYLRQNPKLQRRALSFSATWHTTADKLFPLLCPAREADWIPGWNCRMIYSGTGYAEDKCVFTTDAANPLGSGTWAFTRYEQNKLVKFVRIDQNIFTHAGITLTDNNDGTVTGTWNLIDTALTEKGNKQLEKQPDPDESARAIFHMIDTYLKKGKKQGRASLFMKMLHGHKSGGD